MSNISNEHIADGLIDGFLYTTLRSLVNEPGDPWSEILLDSLKASAVSIFVRANRQGLKDKILEFLN